MIKQEEIREGLAIHLYNRLEFGKKGIYWRDSFETTRKYFLQLAGSSLVHLGKRDVVIKVDRELPENLNASWVKIEDDIFTELEWNSQKALDKAGYVAIEPLIGM